MDLNLKKLLARYLKKKKPLGIITDVIFVVLVVLFLLPSTRKDVAAFFIRLTSFPPSTLDNDEQPSLSNNTLQWPLYDLNGHKVFFDELNDKPVFLNIWATWCPPCIAELPSIRSLYEDYGDKVQFILVSNEDVAKVKRFARENDYDLPFYLSGTVPDDFYTKSIPTTFIISRDGRIVVNKKGAARWNSDASREILDQLLNE